MWSPTEAAKFWIGRQPEPEHGPAIPPKNDRVRYNKPSIDSGPEVRPYNLSASSQYNRVKTIKALQSKKGAINGSKLHPNSRRAKQIQRVELRTRKLDIQKKVQRSTEVGRIDRHLYFVHALDDEVASVSLPELHQIMRDYINRNEEELAELAREREQRNSWRKGEGKNKREQELEKAKDEEEGEYRAGFALPDLTLAENVFFCRQWINPLPSKANKHPKGGDPSFLGRIRLIRISSLDESSVTVVQEGAREGEWNEGEGEVEMGEDDEADEDEEDE